MKLIAAIARRMPAPLVNRYWRAREGIAHAEMVRHWRKAGHSAPEYAANRELFLRAHIIEEFRDFASDAYLSAGASLDASKSAFIKAKLHAKTSTLTSADTKMMRAILVEMEHDEVFHGEAKRKWNAEIDAIRAELAAHNLARRGHSGHHHLVSRVLRNH